MTANEFHGMLETVLVSHDEKGLKSLVEKFVYELSLDISAMTAHKVTSLTGGLVSGLLRQYADAIDKHTDTRKNACNSIFCGSESNGIQCQRSVWCRRRKMTNVQREKYVFVKK